MKFTAQKTLLANGLATVKNSVAANGSLPVLTGVLVEAKSGAVKLTTTNLDMVITAEVEAEVSVPGSIVVNFGKCYSFVNSMPLGGIDCQLKRKGNQNVLEMVAGECRTTTVTIDAMEFPTVAKIDAKAKSVEMDQKDLMAALTFVRHAFGVNQSRRQLMGAMVEIRDDGTTFVGTSGSRMAVYGEITTTKPKNAVSLIVPTKLVGGIIDVIKGETGRVRLLSGSGMVRVEAVDNNRWSVQGKLIDKECVQWRNAIPLANNGYCNRFKVDRSLFMDQVERARQAVAEYTGCPCITVEATDGVMSADGSNSEYTAHSEMRIDYAGEELASMLNPDYLMEALRAANDDEITVTFKDGDSPIMFTGESGTTEVIMPLRVN